MPSDLWRRLREAVSSGTPSTRADNPSRRVDGIRFPFPADRFYLLWILAADLSLLLPPLRFPGALFLTVFLPGYLVVERLTLFTHPFSAAIGSIGLSVLLTPLISLPWCLLFQRVTPLLILFALHLFLLGLLITFKNHTEKVWYQRPKGWAWSAPTLLLICAGIFFYVDLTGVGPYSEDWTYNFAIFKESSRHIPPRDPEASFLPLRYPWGFYFLYGLIHRLSGVAAWKVFAFAPVVTDFAFLGTTYLILVRVTRNPSAGLWGILLFTVGIQSDWVLRGLMGQGWDPAFAFNLHWEDSQALTGYMLLWGWYLPPAILPELTAFYFLIRHLQGKKKEDFWMAWGACAIGPFFHPVYYLGFMAGLTLFLFLRWLHRESHFRLLLLLATFYFFLKPDPPNMPLYRFRLDPAGILSALWDFFRLNALVLPFAVWAAMASAEARKWFVPFALLFALLCILGRGEVNHGGHILFQNRVYLTLIASVGLGWLGRFPRSLRAVLSFSLLLILVLPFSFQVAHRIQSGWQGAADAEQQAAGAFIRSQTDEYSVFLILPDSRYSMVCVEGFGERRLVWGWYYHLNRYLKEEALNEIRAKIQRVFQTVDPAYRRAFVASFRPAYLFLGPDERHFLEKHRVDLKKFLEGLSPVYASENIQIYRFRPIPPGNGVHLFP